MSSDSKRKRMLPAERRTEIIDRAVEVAEFAGLGAITIKGIARDLGITSGLISHYFGTLDELIATAFRLLSSRIKDDLPGDRDTADPVGQLAYQLFAYVEPSNRTTSRIWLEAVYLSASLPQVKVAITEEMRRDFDSLVLRVQRVMDLTKQTTGDATTVANGLLAIVDGRLVQLWLGEDAAAARLVDNLYRQAEVDLALEIGTLRGLLGSQGHG